MRFAVFPQCVVRVPEGQGGLTDEQRDVLVREGLVTLKRAGA